jgi:serine phosphatase RsbU (regulator of sigma subunit)
MFTDILYIYPMTFYVRLVFILAMLACGKLHASGVLTLDNKQEYPVSAAMDIFHDAGGKLTIDDVRSEKYASQFTPVSDETPSFPQIEGYLWIRFTVQNNSNADDWLLELRNAYAAVSDLYVPGDNDKYTLIPGGFFQPFERSRLYAYEFYTQRLPIAHGETKTFYFKVGSPTPILLSMFVLSHKKFIQRATVLEYMLGIYYGIIIVLFIYSMFNYFALRSKSYLWYGFYVLAISALIFCIDGRMFRYLTSDYPILNIKMLDITMVFSVFFGMAYGRSFLNTCQLVPRLDKAMDIIMKLLLVAGVAVIPFTPLWFGIALSKIIPVPAMLLLLIAGWLCYKRGHRPARMFLIGFGVFAIGGSLTNLAFAAVIPSNIVTLYAIHAGSALEAIILVFGLSQQMRLLKHEKESAQEATILQLKENEQLQTKVNRELEQKVKERTSEIESQKTLIEEKNKDILDSILYARRIQRAILPDESSLQKILKDHFVLYKPKDIVSGDFYWAEDKKGMSLFAAVDCTGHGVPGAFVSMLGYNGLNEAVNEKDLTDPAAILNELDNYLHRALKHSQQQTIVKDGMDIALCCIDWSREKLYFAGAVNPAYIVRSGQIIILKGDRFAIGGELTGEEKQFATQEFALQKGDTIYVFSDGYADQFGGEKGKKFMSRQFKEALVNVNGKMLSEQREVLDDMLNKWRGTLEQVDDVLVIGVRI